MLAMVFHEAGQPLVAEDRPVPTPGDGQLLIKVKACGVCRTDLHVVDGELPNPNLHVVPGHEIVGEVTAIGDDVSRFAVGDRVGVPWLGGTCGKCRYCTRGRENLCDDARFTGYTLDGGYAEYTLANGDFCVAIPDSYSDVEAAPLLCAGLIGYRSLKMAGDGKAVGDLWLWSGSTYHRTGSALAGAGDLCVRAAGGRGGETVCSRAGRCVGW
jgi:propanol-preferring alcohol dehydrogenase